MDSYHDIKFNQEQIICFKEDVDYTRSLKDIVGHDIDKQYNKKTNRAKLHGCLDNQNYVYDKTLQNNEIKDVTLNFLNSFDYLLNDIEIDCLKEVYLSDVKTEMCGYDKKVILNSIRKKFAENDVDFSDFTEGIYE